MADIIEHYGVKRRSGRYPWGSGEDPQRSKDVLSRVDELRGKGLTEKQIAEELGMNTTQLRTEIAWANEVRKQVLMDSITSRKERGMSNTDIAKELGIAESSVRNYMSNKDKVKTDQLENITKTLEEAVNQHEYLDVGVGTELQMGISRTKLKAAVAKLKEEGYVEHEIYVKRLNDPSKYTTIKVLTKETDLEVVKQNSDKIRPPEVYFEEGGRTSLGLRPIQMVDFDRIQIVGVEDGGEDRDGLMELRRGVDDLNLGNAKYAQVRIGVGGTHYLKGMAMYGDDLPDGVDIRFYTNKSKNLSKQEVLKKLKDNPDNPFGATIKVGGQKGALNIVNEEGDWNEWKSKLSAQFLSKQPLALVKDRLSATKSRLEAEFDEIDMLTNPIVKKHLMSKYAEGVDSKSKHLKVLGLPRTKGHVILPFPEMNPNEVYAPNYKNGEKVVLVRYPHGGTFELPELTVNNKGAAKGAIGNALDAIGIHPSVARKLSGADFDGDTVYVIPNKGQVKTSRTLKELANFDPNMYRVDHPTITPDRKQKLMGQVSNLITDMTIKGATQSEIARAVKHSMVVIDSEKHQLDHKQSAIDNGISALKKRYQTHTNPLTGKESKGASTFISKRKDVKEVVVNETTGKRKTVVNNLYDKVSDVRELSSGTAVENLYVDYVKDLRNIATKSKKIVENIPSIKRDKDAAKVYSKEVKSLETKLNVALANAPRERQAQLLANNTYYKNLDYDMDKDQKKKLKSQALAEARVKTGAKKTLVDITDREWEAIQSNAISNNMLDQILNNADMDKVKKLATPKTTVKLTDAKVSRAKTLINNGYTYAEVAESIGVSVSALRDNIE